MLAGRPPQLGRPGCGGSTGLVEADGAYSVGSCGGPGMPLQSLQASGSNNLRVGGQYWGQVAGVVSKRVARVRVLFDMGIPPLTWCRLRSGTACRSTSTPASTSSRGRMSGPVPGRSSGWSPSTRGAARSQSARLGEDAPNVSSSRLAGRDWSSQRSRLPHKYTVGGTRTGL